MWRPGLGPASGTKGEVDKGQDQANLEQESCDGGEGVPTPKVAAVMKTVQFFQPGGGPRKQIADPGDIVREDRTCGSGKKLGQGVMHEKGRADQQDKKAKG